MGMLNSTTSFVGILDGIVFLALAVVYNLTDYDDVNG